MFNVPNVPPYILDYLDQYQIELGISPIHQVYSCCNAPITISAPSCYLWTYSAKET